MIIPIMVIDFSIVNDGDDSETDIYIWGAQLEEGSYATSLHPNIRKCSYKVTRYCIQEQEHQVIFNSAEGVLFVEVGALK